jgi:hypothetical protein
MDYCEIIVHSIKWEIFEDTKGVTRRRKSKKDKHYNVQKKQDKSSSNDLQNTTQKTEDRVTQTLLDK